MPEPKEVEVVTDIKKFETRHPAPVPAVRTDSPMDAIMVAIEKGYDPAFIEKMMDLSDRHKKNEARKSYVRAMAAFKANPPKILKDSHVEYKGTKYDHASLGNVTETISQALSQNDLTAAWETDQGENKITVTCHITHIAGHSEKTALSAGADSSGSKNAIQAIGSTITYLQRYTLLAITGLAAMGQDDDGKGAEPVKPVKVITIEQAQAIAKGVKQAGVDKEKFLKLHKIEKFEQLTEVGLRKAQAQVARRIKENKKATNADN